MKKLITLLASVILLSGCDSRTQSGTEDGLITVDVTATYPKKELILQDIFDVEYIPLETNDEFLTAGHVQAIGNDIIIIRNSYRTGNSILIFDRKTGEGLRMINRRGQGNEEYIAINGLITFDEDNGEMFVQDPAINNILVYDLFGNFKRRIKHTEKEYDSSMFGIRFDPIYNFDQNNLICHDYTSGRDFNRDSIDLKPRSIFYIISKEDGSLIKEIIIPFERKLSQVLRTDQGIGFISNSGLVPNRDNWILTEPSADTIYSYSPDHQLKSFMVRYPSVQSMDPEVFLFPGVITDDYIFMQTIKKEYDETDPRGLLKKDLVYDRQDNITFEYIVLNDDFTYKRPITNLVDAMGELTVINNNEIAFIEKIDAFELVEAYEEGKLNGRLKEIAATLDEESNPVIMVVKHKQ